MGIILPNTCYFGKLIIDGSVAFLFVLLSLIFVIITGILSHMKTFIHDATAKKNKLSIHPKVAAFFDILIGGALLWYFGKAANSWWVVAVWFIIRLVWWVGVMRIVYYAPVIRRLDHIRSLFTFQIGILAVMLFVDWSVNWYTWGTLFVVGSALSFWLLPTSTSELSFIGKPHIRWCLILSVFGLAGVWSAAAAVVVFYSMWAWVAAWVVSMFWTLFISLIWWRYYNAPREHITWSWIFLLGAALLPVSAVLLLWPIGFLITGTLITWFWYILWQLGRFYFSPDGINWKKQARFLVSNAMLIVLAVTVLARWR